MHHTYSPHIVLQTSPLECTLSTEVFEKKEGIVCWAVFVHAFNSSIWKAEAGKSL